MRTSHVGSFPLPHRDEYIERILVDLFNIGLDVPPYPQMRSFIDIYLEPLVELGILEKHGDNYFSTKEKLLNTKPLKLGIPEANKAIDIIKKKNLKFKGLRAPVTGVFTLASRVYIEKDIAKGLSATALPHIEILENFFIPYVENFVKYVVDLGYSIVFIDEPILGVLIGKRRILFNYTEESIIKIINRVLSHAKSIERAIHVCGSISPKLFEILTKVDYLHILNFEFHDTPQNISIIDTKLLEQYDKVLAPGIASAKKPIIESIDEMLNLLKKIYENTHGRIDLISADCGFGGLRGTIGNPEEEYRIGIEKLRNIVETVKKFSSHEF